MRLLFILVLSIILSSSDSSVGTVTAEIVRPDKIEKKGKRIQVTGSSFQLILVKEAEIQTQQTLHYNAKTTFEVQNDHYTLIYP